MNKTNAELLKENLEQKNEIKLLHNLIETLNGQLSLVTQQLKDSNAEAVKLRGTVQTLTDRIAGLLNQVYGPRSERARIINPYQMSLFGDDEQETKPVGEPPSGEVEEDAPVKPKTKRKRKRNELPKGAQEIKTVVGLPPEKQFCPKHPEIPLVEVGESYVRTVIHYTPAKLVIENIYRIVYQCPKCKKEGTFSLVNARVPNALLPHSRLTASLAAHILTRKFMMGLPFERQTIEFNRLGYELESKDMSQWTIALEKYYFQYITDYLHKELLKTDVIHADETPVQVHREDGRKDTSESYLWMFGTGPFEDGHPIRIFVYRPGRSGDYAKEFLRGFKGTLVHDQYAGYNKVKNVTHAGCLDHLRRKFVDAQKCAPKGTCGIASEAIKKLGELYVIEKELKEETVEKRQKERQARAKKIAEDFFAWLKEKQPTVPAQSKTGKAISYALKGEKTYLEYLKNGKVCMTNAPAERAIRPVAVGRKNWLFCGSPRGAKACASLYSIVETCKANGLDPGKYLNYILERMPEEGNPGNPEVIEKYMPWSTEIQNNCKA